MGKKRGFRNPESIERRANRGVSRRESREIDNIRAELQVKLEEGPIEVAKKFRLNNGTSDGVATAVGCTATGDVKLEGGSASSNGRASGEVLAEPVDDDGTAGQAVGAVDGGVNPERPDEPAMERRPKQPIGSEVGTR